MFLHLPELEKLGNMEGVVAAASLAMAAEDLSRVPASGPGSARTPGRVLNAESSQGLS